MLALSTETAPECAVIARSIAGREQILRDLYRQQGEFKNCSRRRKEDLLRQQTLKPAVQTAKHAKDAKGKASEWTRTFTRWEHPASLPMRSASA
jgi:hypothetical protein